MANTGDGDKTWTLGRPQVASVDASPQASRPRRDSTASIGSFYSDVEMAQDEVFAGPTSESLPSNSSFVHRRRHRTQSDASWSFYEPSIQGGETLDGDEATYFDQDLDNLGGYDARDSLSLHRKPSVVPESADQPLLHARNSYSGETPRPLNVGQKIYIVPEDLTIAITGFDTSGIGHAIYIALCICTLGMAWVVFRWFPRLHVRLVGKKAPLASCKWAVIESQWNEFALLNVQHRNYNQPQSTIFGAQPQAIRSGCEEYDDDPNVSVLRIIDYRYIRFCYHPLHDKFILNHSWKDPAWNSLKALRTGLYGDVKTYRKSVFGENVIDIEEKSSAQLLVDEAFHPFYVFQIASLILWSLDEYYYYAVCIFILSAFSIISTLIETKTTMRRLREISRFVCDVRVLRNGFWRYVSSTDLVPGDVYELTDPGLSLLPCDSILLTGDCIVNESMLTGESVPVSKTPCTQKCLDELDLGTSAIHPSISKHFLFSGTKIIRARRPQARADDEAVGLALVVRTGFNTAKGALVRSMLFPKPSGFKFYRDSFYYIGVMAMIAAFGFVVSFVNFIRLGMPWHTIVIRALDLITIVVPPALPATLTIGTNFALNRLKKRNIFCISPQRVNVSGKLDVICFDKTGTLTEDGLDVLGVHCVRKDMKAFTDLLKTANGIRHLEDDSATYKNLFHTMTTCHSLRRVDNVLIGDPLDIKMFEFTGWEFEEGDGHLSEGDHTTGSGLSPAVVRAPGSPDAELGILRSFEFDPQLRRTSVIVKRFRAAGGDIYVKGAPECMKDICDASTFPVNFEKLLEHYTHNGYRVIGCATRHIKNLSWIKSQKMKRQDAESGLSFAGFIIFENKLKPQTTPVIIELQRASIRKVMCTGDNILTAISVAKNCRLLDDSLVFVPHFSEGDSRNPNAKLRWQTVDENPISLDDETLLPIYHLSSTDITSPYDMHMLHNYSMAVTGEVFRWVTNHAPNEYINRLLVRAQVFARMSPDEKQELVEKLQNINYCVGFCGDGANDCGALKAADVGISLSEAEASVAAPFTSRVFDISCVPQVIREGRAALVTSFSCFKYMSLYSAIQFTSVSILYKFGSNLGDFQFLFIDLFLILPIAVFMSWTGPYPVLTPKRPTASLVSRKVLTPLLGQIFIASVFQIISYKLVKRQPWYVKPRVDDDKTKFPSSPNTTLFLFSCYQYIFAGIILNAGPPYRLSMRHNYPYMVTTLASVLFVTYMLFSPHRWLFRVMELTEMSVAFKLQLITMAVAHLAIASLGERYVLPSAAYLISTISNMLSSTQKMSKKQYKILELQMRV